MKNDEIEGSLALCGGVQLYSHLTRRTDLFSFHKKGGWFQRRDERFQNEQLSISSDDMGCYETSYLSH